MENLRYFVVVNTYNDQKFQPNEVSFFDDGVRCVSWDEYGCDDIFLKKGEYEIEWIDVPIDNRTEAEYNADMREEAIRVEEKSKLYQHFKVKLEKEMEEEFPEHFKYVELIKKIGGYTGKTSAFDIVDEYIKNIDLSEIFSPEDADKLYVDFNKFIDTHNWFFFNPTFGCEVTCYPSQRYHPEEYTEFMRTEIKNIIEAYDKEFKNRLGVDFSKFFKASILRKVYYNIKQNRLAKFYDEIFKNP